MTALASAEDVSRFAESLYGEQLGAMDGVLHVVAIAEPERIVMRIGDHSPKSATDFFALSLARARVEAIVVTGAVLRAEPELRYELATPLAAWRREVAGLASPPFLLVLTGGEIPLDHPALASWARPIVFTTHAAAERMRAQARVEIVGHDAPSARAAIEHLRRVRGCRSVSIEAGPRTAVPLYDPPLAIDVLALSVFVGPLDPVARGGAFPSEAGLASAGLRRVSAARRDEASGGWRFERWVR